MRQLTVIFVGKTVLNEKGEVLESPFSHALIELEIEGKLRSVESTRSTVRIGKSGEFDWCGRLKKIQIPLTTEQYGKIVDKAFDLTCRTYGNLDPSYDVMCEQCKEEKCSYCKDDVLVNCYTMIVILLQEVFPDFLSEYSFIDTIEAFYDEIMVRWG